MKFPFQDWLILSVGQFASQFWWFGLLVVLFAWAVVPVMRMRESVLDGEEGSTSRFWWAPGWGYLGISGVGIALMSSPLLNPDLAGAWHDALWSSLAGISTDWQASTYAILVAVGLVLFVKGLLLYAHAWALDRSLRYRAWRWSLATRGSRREVACILCGARFPAMFPIGKGNPRRTCSDVLACKDRQARRKEEAAREAAKGRRLL